VASQSSPAASARYHRISQHKLEADVFFQSGFVKPYSLRFFTLSTLQHVVYTFSLHF